MQQGKAGGGWGAQDGVAAGIRLPAEVNYAVAPRVRAWVCGLVWWRICGLITCELQGLGVFHFSFPESKNLGQRFSCEQWYLRDQYSGGFQATKSIKHQLS